MVYIYIATVVVMLVLILFISLAILTISKTTCANIKKKTMELASLYDYLLEGHSHELHQKKRLIEQLGYNATEPSPAAQSVAAPTVTETAQTSASTMQTIENINKAQYQNPVVAGAYQEIRENFDVSLDDVLEKVPALKQKESESLAQKLLALLPYETMYSMSFLSEQEQLACLQDTLPAEYMPVLTTYLQQSETFFSLDFYTYLRERAEEESPKTVIRVSPNVATKDAQTLQVEVSDEICEGIQVEVNHLLYDFAIEKKEMGWVCQH